MTTEYQRPLAAPGGLRLHLNENTAGCSPVVLEAIQRLTVEDIAFYPEYDAIIQQTATFLGVTSDSLLLTNGLDEGILAAVVAASRPTVTGEGGSRPEAIVALPAFDMYGVSTRAAGGLVIEVPPRPDFEFPVDAVLASISNATRLVFITSPNNPTGVRVRLNDIDRVAAALPTQAFVFVDEAYHDFCGDTALPLAGERTNVIVGRTFAKAHGLAALRVGCVIAHPATLPSLRAVVPPYSLNVCAMAGLSAALSDRNHLRWYVEQVQQSRDLVYGFCRRFDLTCWPSGANFVLVRLGSRATEVVRRLAERGVFVRDRSGDSGCAGCVRITAGVVAHTDRCLAAMEEILCDAR